MVDAWFERTEQELTSEQCLLLTGGDRHCSPTPHHRGSYATINETATTDKKRSKSLWRENALDMDDAL
jgi:hypothetical protein